MKIFTPLRLISLCALAATPAFSQATFTVLGGNGTRPWSMSPDGQWITGWDFNGQFRWSSGTGFDSFTGAANGFPDIAIGGLPVAATLINGGNEEAGYWTPTGVTYFGGIGGQSGTSISSCYGCSDDGSAVVGLAWVNAGQAHAFRWTSGTGMVDLGSTISNRSSRANGVSGNGLVVVGWDEMSSGPRQASIWPNATPGPVLLAPGVPGEAWAATPTGSVVTGINADTCFRWTQAGGLVSLGKLPDSVPADDATGMSISADGNTIVGIDGNSFFGTPFRPFIWRPGAGMVNLKDLLLALGASNVAPYALSQAVEVSDDGRTICGISGALPFGPFEGWVAKLPEVAQSYCTAQINSLGCLPSVGFTGTPSASSGAGFHVTASNILAGVNGLMFYSTIGANNAPFLGGILCAQPPLQRLPIQNSGGVAGCSGSFDSDFNAWVPTSGDAALVGGATVWAQYWSRDAASASTTNLTDALRFTLWP